MRVLLVHNQYKFRGGEDTVFSVEGKMLRDYGHHVTEFTVTNDAIVGIAGKLTAFCGVGGTAERERWAFDLATEHRPDIVHIHNFFPLVTPSAHIGFKKYGAKVIQTLHNFRIGCSNAQLIRNGSPCEDCIVGSRLNGVKNKCYKDSYIGSIAQLIFQENTLGSKKWIKCVDKFIALTDFSKDIFVRMGLPPEKITVKPNSTMLPEPIKRGRSGVIFVGRLSKEKGAHILVEGAKRMPEVQFTIVGEGEERNALELIASPNVHFVGKLPQRKVWDLMNAASVLVFPSVWYEGFPMTILEAFASGLPVLASRLGAMREVICHGQNGRLFNPGDTVDFLFELSQMLADKTELDRMSTNARADFEDKYSIEVNYKQLMSVYQG